MNNTVIFIHGMFLTGKCWESWIPFFERRGYRCLAPDWPLHNGEPADLRAGVPPGLGELDLDTLLRSYRVAAGRQDSLPIFIGHSLGGLIAQELIAEELGAAAVCLNSVAPNAMMSINWGFLKNSAKIANPLEGDDPFLMSEDGFHAVFTNTLNDDESAAVYERYAVHESRNVLRDAMGRSGRVVLDQPHAPLLFLSAENDRMIPPKLNRRNASAYIDPSSVTEEHEFPGRGHFMLGEPGWEEVAGFAADWLELHVDSTSANSVQNRWSSFER